MVRISAFHADGPGSIPGRRINYFPQNFCFFASIGAVPVARAERILSLGSVGLVVMTLALHARGPQFNPGTKYFLEFLGAISH